jgi:hypothetical protein
MLPPDHRLLRRALLGNAAFSGACAVPLLFTPDAVASWLGLPESLLLPGLGLGLLAFAGALVVLAIRPRPTRSWVLAVIAADAAWVVGTVILLLSPWAGSLSGPGIWTVILVAAVVSAWGLLQAAGARAMDRPSGEAPS